MTQPSPEFFALQEAVVGRYSLEREIGRGGMGIVFLARDVALDRPVAIKLLPPALAAVPDARTRFLREARTAARLSHPHIVPIHAVEEHGVLVFYVMAYVDGETLGERVRRAGPLSARDAMRVTQEVAWALGHAHARGVVHRDVKPDNVLLERGSGRALVTDFGIARAVEGGTPADGTAIGTPAYMSPEQAAGETVDARSDVYSLGVTAFFAASGRLPFEAPTAVGMLARHAAERAPPLLTLRPSLPPGFGRLVDRCLAKAPAERWADGDALAAALGDPRDALPEVPRPVQSFVYDADAAGAQLGTALLAIAVSLAWAVNVRDFLGIFQAVLIVGAVITLGLAGLRLAQVVQRARGLLRVGYGHAAVRSALAIEDRQGAQAAVDGGSAPAGWRGWRDGALVGLGVAAGVAGYWLARGDRPLGLDLLGVVAMVVLPAAALQRLWTVAWRGRRGLWHRLLDGGFGRAVFALARVGERGAPVRPAGGEPTVVALGRAADALFDALPAHDRRRLGDVPALVERLQADALALRARAGDPAAASRLQTAVAALESVRLDLLRLHAGGGSLDELTRSVDAVRELGARIDAELAGREEVDRLLGRGGRVPTPA